VVQNAPIRSPVLTGQVRECYHRLEKRKAAALCLIVRNTRDGKGLSEQPKTAVIPPRPRDNRNPILEMPRQPRSIRKNVSMIAERSAGRLIFLRRAAGAVIPNSSLFLPKSPGQTAKDAGASYFFPATSFSRLGTRRRTRNNYLTSPEEMIMTT